MSDMLPEGRQFSFTERPLPLPGDLRISWRIALALLMLVNSRGKKASLAKMHLLNDALRSESAKKKLNAILNGKLPKLSWRMRVEPAFGRAIDFLVGEGFANWVIASGRAGLVLTSVGEKSATAVLELDETLSDEKTFLEAKGKTITEGFVNEILGAGREL